MAVFMKLRPAAARNHGLQLGSGTHDLILSLSLSSHIQVWFASLQCSQRESLEG